MEKLDKPPAAIAVSIARCALDSLQSLPTGDRPRENEWTPFAAIVAEVLKVDDAVDELEKKDEATRDDESKDTRDNQLQRKRKRDSEDPEPAKQFYTVSLATGSRCLGSAAARASAHVVCDMHAEVLAVRTLRRRLIDEATSLLHPPPHPSSYVLFITYIFFFFLLYKHTFL